MENIKKTITDFKENAEFYKTDDEDYFFKAEDVANFIKKIEEQIDSDDKFKIKVTPEYIVATTEGRVYSFTNPVAAKEVCEELQKHDKKCVILKKLHIENN